MHKNVPLFMSQIQRLGPEELRFVMEALHDGAALAGHEACACPDDADACMARKHVLDELWNRLAADINIRHGRVCAEEGAA
jgi:hypothetical protein